MAFPTIDDYSDQLTATRNVGHDPLRPTESHGRVRVATFKSEIAGKVVGSVIALALIPTGATILDLVAQVNQDPSSAEFDFGYVAADGGTTVDLSRRKEGNETENQGFETLSAGNDQDAFNSDTSWNPTTGAIFRATAWGATDPIVPMAYQFDQAMYITVTVLAATVPASIELTGYVTYVID